MSLEECKIVKRNTVRVEERHLKSMKQELDMPVKALKKTTGSSTVRY